MPGVIISEYGTNPKFGMWIYLGIGENHVTVTLSLETCVWSIKISPVGIPHIGVCVHLWVAECRILFQGHCDLDLLHQV